MSVKCSLNLYSDMTEHLQKEAVLFVFLYRLMLKRSVALFIVFLCLFYLCFKNDDMQTYVLIRQVGSVVVTFPVEFNLTPCSLSLVGGLSSSLAPSFS